MIRLSRLIAWRIRWIRWALEDGVRAGDPMLGDSREERNRNIKLMADRWRAREPKRPD